MSARTSAPRPPGPFPTRLVLCQAVLLSFALAAASWAVAPSTRRVSRGMDNTRPLTGAYNSEPALSADGRFVVFTSDAGNFAPVAPAQASVFLKDRVTGAMELVNRRADNSPALGAAHPAITADGRYVAFSSSDPELVPGDTNAGMDVFVRDRALGTLERVSVASGGSQGSADSGQAVALSADGRFVVFHSLANNLVSGDTNEQSDVFVRDRVLGTTERVSPDLMGSYALSSVAVSADGRYVTYTGYDPARYPIPVLNMVRDVLVRDRSTGALEAVSISTAGERGEMESLDPSISADGRFVVFGSAARNLAPGGLAFFPNVFLRDRQEGTTVLVSYAGPPYEGSGSGVQGTISADGGTIVFASTSYIVPTATYSWAVYARDRVSGIARRVDVASDGTPSDRSYAGRTRLGVSADGRFVAFASEATNLHPADQNAGTDLYVRDGVEGTTTLISITADGVQGEAGATSADAVLSADGEVVAFRSNAHNLTPGDTNRAQDVFAWSRSTGVLELVSVPADGGMTGGGETNSPPGSGGIALSETGRYVAFTSAAALVPGDTNGMADVFVRDREALTTVRVSVADNGAEGNGSASWSDSLSISADGRFVCFTSFASNLVPGDTNGSADIFVRDTVLNRTERVSVATGGGEALGYSSSAMISPDGRYVVFVSAAPGLVPGPANIFGAVFLRDRQLGTTEVASLTSAGVPTTLGGGRPVVSAGGQYVAFVTNDDAVIPGPTNFEMDVYLRDRVANTTEWVSKIPGGGDRVALSPDGRFVAYSAPTLPYNGQVYVLDRSLAVVRRVDMRSDGLTPPALFAAVTPGALSADGRFVVFTSTDGALDPTGTPGAMDVYLRDLGAPTETPGNFTATPLRRVVYLNWTDRSSDETGFRIERRVEGRSFQLLATVPAGATVYQDEATEWLTRYEYRIQALSPNGNSDFSPVVAVITGQPVPGTPTGLTATPLSSTSIRIDWNDVDDLETAFRVERSADGEVTWALVGSAPANAETLVDTGLQPNTAYRYRVWAINDAGPSDPGPTVGASTHPNAPAAPTNFTGVALTEASIRLAWTDAATETGYRLERRSGPGEFALVTLLDAGATTYTNTGLTPNTSYTYRLVAFNAGGESDPALVTVATRATPGGILVMPRALNFGTVRVGKSKQLALWIENRSRTEELRITLTAPDRAQYSIGGAVGTQYLAPRSRLRIWVTFTPTAKPRVGGQLRVESSDPRNGSQMVLLVGRGK